MKCFLGTQEGKQPQGGEMRLLVSGLCMALALGCSQQSNQASFNNFDGPEAQLDALKTEIQLSIKGPEGYAIPGAQVLVGMDFSEDKFFTADENGVVVIPDTLWSEATIITVDAPDFVRASFIGFEPGSREIQLNKKAVSRNFGVKGITTGFGKLKKDKWADFSMVAPIFSKKHLIGFDLSYVISNQMDKMSVYGQEISIPSNISFPKQKENYGIFPVTLNKPSYKMPFYFAGQYELGAIHGRFPFKKVVGKMREGKSIFDVVNDFQFKQIGFTTLDISGPDHEANLPINHIEFNVEKDFVAPQFDQEEILMLISLNKKENGFFPSGLRKVAPGDSFKLKFAENFEHHMLAVLTKEEEGANMTTAISSDMSIQVMALNQSAQVNLLDKVEKPQVSESGLSLFPPSVKSGVDSLGTYLSLTKFNDVENPHVEITDSQKQWEVYSAEWLSELRLPEWPTGLAQTEKLRWEVMFLGTSSKEVAEPGPTQIRKASHVSRNTVDL